MYCSDINCLVKTVVHVVCSGFLSFLAPSLPALAFDLILPTLISPAVGNICTVHMVVVNAVVCCYSLPAITFYCCVAKIGEILCIKYILKCIRGPLGNLALYKCP